MLVETGDLNSIPQPLAINIASRAWISRISQVNLLSGFIASGLCPLNKAKMLSRLALFKDGGTPAEYSRPAWIERRCVIRQEMLTLPVEVPKSQRTLRKTIDVGGRILDLSLLAEIDSSKEARKIASAQKKALREKRAKKKNDRAVICRKDCRKERNDNISVNII